jgi:8-amino-7-oxononanoate synthase
VSKGKFGLSGRTRDELIQRFLHREPEAPPADESTLPASRRTAASSIPDAFCRFDRFPGYEKLLVPQTASKRLGVSNPYFRVHEGVASATTQIEGRSFINFSNYNYLGLAGHPKVNKAARDAIERYGTSASASRVVAGERPIVRDLEQALAQLYEVEDCIVFVSGHATNVSTIGYLFGPKDLVIHDALIHNSVLEGIRLAGAARRSFPHNDAAALDAILGEIRGQFERTLVVVEGLYSMDGDVPDLPRFIDVKTRHKAFLMVDEAHSPAPRSTSGWARSASPSPAAVASSPASGHWWNTSSTPHRDSSTASACPRRWPPPRSRRSRSCWPSPTAYPGCASAPASCCASRARTASTPASRRASP